MSGETETVATSPESRKDIVVSIIMPVYNAAKYLDRSIQSIINQSFERLELICIDDASTDNSIAIIESYMSKDSRIKLLRQEANAGAPAARNLGIDHALGEYLMFVDADDALHEDAISTLAKASADRGSDAVKGCMQLESADGRRRDHRLNQKKAWENTNLSHCREIQHLYQYQSYIFRSAILREHDIRFEPTLKNFQDPVFMSLLLPECDRIDVLLDAVYIRVDRIDSIITSTWSHENFSSLIKGIGLAYDHLLAKGQIDTARLMALNITRWWYKFETMTENMDRDECIEIFKELRALDDRVRHPLYRFRPAKIGTYYYLSLITSGRYGKCAEELEKARKLSNIVPRAGVKLYDTARALRHLVFRAL